MNWLAHIFLSEHNIDFQIGNYLADPLKAKAWEGANEDIQKAMQIHKLIDSYTDKHPTFKQSKNRLGKDGLLKAVVIDLTYDYLLTKNWHRYSSIMLDDFLDDFYTNANANMHALPSEAKQKLKRLIEFDLLNKYQTLEQLNESFQRVDKRISSRVLKRDNVSRYYEIVCENIDDIEDDFLLFFPQLCKKVRENINNSKLRHWKI